MGEEKGEGSVEWGVKILREWGGIMKVFNISDVVMWFLIGR